MFQNLPVWKEIKITKEVRKFIQDHHFENFEEFFEEVKKRFNGKTKEPKRKYSKSFLERQTKAQLIEIIMSNS